MAKGCSAEIQMIERKIMKGNSSKYTLPNNACATCQIILTKRKPVIQPVEIDFDSFSTNLLIRNGSSRSLNIQTVEKKLLNFDHYHFDKLLHISNVM